MKPKDIFALILLAIVLITIGSFGVSKFAKHGQGRSAEIEVIQPIDPNFDINAQNILQGRDPNFTSQSFSTPVDLKGGFGNHSPF